MSYRIAEQYTCDVCGNTTDRRERGQWYTVEHHTGIVYMTDPPQYPIYHFCCLTCLLIWVRARMDGKQ